LDGGVDVIRLRTTDLSTTTSVPERFELQTPGVPEATEPRGPGDRVGRPALIVISACLSIVAFAQSWGRIVDDTKLDLVMSPMTYMRDSLHLWTPLRYFGSVESQTWGFLFPMGPFFALGKAAHLPVWITERLWLSLILAVAFWGTVRLADALHIGRPWTRVVAGVAYTFMPLTATWAATSAALLTVALLPWVIVPLVRGSREGSTRQAAARSGLAFVCMGGVNASVVLAVLPLPVLFLLTRRPGPRRRALAAWWAVALGLAFFWWIVPAAIGGKYGFNYLPFTERANITTATTSAFETLRGASYWVDYFNISGPLIPGAWTLVSSIGPILGTAGVTALGLFGLTRKATPERLFLVASVSAGVVAMGVGYGGSFGGPFASVAQNLLNGPLAVLRNVSKFGPIVALPLALGTAAALSPLTLPWASHGAVQWRHLAAVRPFLHLGIAIVALAAVFWAAMPAWSQRLYPAGFVNYPSYWNAASDWLRAQHDLRTAIVVPAAPFAENTWGRPDDEPLGSVSKESPWATRSIVALSSSGNIEMMDAVEAALEGGVSPPGLASFLASQGVDYIVARNDLDLVRTGAPPPAQVDQVLARTAGLRRVAQFGPPVPASQAERGSLGVFDIPVAQMDLRAIDIYRVDTPGSMVDTFPGQSPLVVSGDPGSMLAAATLPGLSGRATVLSGDPNVGPGVQAAAGASALITDGNQRRDVSFGGVRDNRTYVLGPDQLSPLTGREPQSFSVTPAVAYQTVAAPIGAAEVTSSSYGSTLLGPDPAEGPTAAFDGDPATAWVANAEHDSTGQWIQIDFGREVPLSTVKISPVPTDLSRPTIRAVRISTERGSVVGALPADGRTTTLPTPVGSSSWLRITLEQVTPAAHRAKATVARPSSGGLVLGAGIGDIAVAGLPFFFPTLRVPSGPAITSGQAPTYLFSSPLTDANLSLATDPDEEPRLSRSFNVPAPAAFQVSGTVTPRPSGALNGLLPAGTAVLRAQQGKGDRAGAAVEQISASSWLGGLPRFRPDNLLTTSGLPWLAQVGDRSPYVDLRWPAPTTVSSIVLVPSSQGAAPTLISVSDVTDTRVLSVPPGGGILEFPPLRTNSIRVRFLASQARRGGLPSSGFPIVLPVGVERLEVPALSAAPASPPNPDQAFSLPCGQGPSLRLDGANIPTSVSGTLGDLLDLTPLRLTSCTPGSTVRLEGGQHELLANDQASAFKITSVVAQGVRTAPPVAPPSPPARSARILSWGTSPRIAVSAGSETYLRVAQNFNPGWAARLGKVSLEPVQLDGWQQGWKVPAGSAGTVVMTFQPDRNYRLALAIGAALVVVLAVLALLPRRRRGDPAAVHPRVGATPLLILGAGVVLAVVAGYLVLVLVPLMLLGWRFRGALAYVATGSFLAAGVAVATHPGATPGTSIGAFGTPAQVLAIVSLAALVAALVVIPRSSPDPPLAVENTRPPTEVDQSRPSRESRPSRLSRERRENRRSPPVPKARAGRHRAKRSRRWRS
jgi:arabinofuranan 3-O-arabinosyltransferase